MSANTEKRSILMDREAIKNKRDFDSLVFLDGYSKEYVSKDKKIKIWSESKSKSITAELITPYKSMVRAGESVCIAKIRLIDWDGNGKLFDELGFYNRKGYSKFNKNFSLMYAEDIVSSRCEDQNSCVDLIRQDWNNAVEFTNLKELPHKDITIGIFTKTVIGEKVEWVPTISGFDIYEWAAYDVTEIDYSLYNTSASRYPSLVMIDSTHFIIAYTGIASDGYISTHSVDGDCDNITLIDKLEFNAIQAKHNSLAKIDNTHVVLAYNDQYSDGVVATFNVNTLYDIMNIDYIEHDTSDNSYNSIVVIDSTHFILAYTGSGGDGFIKTFSMDADCDNIAQIDSLEHDTSYALHSSLIKIDDTHFMLAYSGGASQYGYIKTFSIDGNYDITQIDVFQNDSDGIYNSLAMIDSTHFILAYTGDDDYGYISTLSIDGSYNISSLDNLEHGTEQSEFNSIVKIDATHFMLAYDSGTDWDGAIKVFSIDGSYEITQVNSMTHSTQGLFQNSLVQIDATHYMLAYPIEGGYGYLKTFIVSGEPTSDIKALNGVAIDDLAKWNGVSIDDYKTIFGISNTA